MQSTATTVTDLGVVSCQCADDASPNSWRCPVHDNQPPAPHIVGCGCCTGGCICHAHQDAPRGDPARVCEYHRNPAHPHRRLTCRGSRGCNGTCAR